MVDLLTGVQRHSGKLSVGRLSPSSAVQSVARVLRRTHSCTSTTQQQTTVRYRYKENLTKQKHLIRYREHIALIPAFITIKYPIINNNNYTCEENLITYKTVK